MPNNVQAKTPTTSTLRTIKKTPNTTRVVKKKKTDKPEQTLPEVQPVNTEKVSVEQVVQPKSQKLYKEPQEPKKQPQEPQPQPQPQEPQPVDSENEETCDGEVIGKKSQKNTFKLTNGKLKLIIHKVANEVYQSENDDSENVNIDKIRIADNCYSLFKEMLLKKIDEIVDNIIVSSMDKSVQVRMSPEDEKAYNKYYNDFVNELMTTENISKEVAENSENQQLFLKSNKYQFLPKTCINYIKTLIKARHGTNKVLGTIPSKIKILVENYISRTCRTAILTMKVSKRKTLILNDIEVAHDAFTNRY